MKLLIPLISLIGALFLTSLICIFLVYLDWRKRKKNEVI